MDCSIVIPIYDQGEFLPFLIASLKAQKTRARYEVIICDDGSSSCPIPQISSLCAGAAFDLRYVWQRHLGRGVARSRNNGIRLARGNILIFIDGDSLLPRSFIESHIVFHSSLPKTLYCGTRELLLISPEQRGTLLQCRTPEQVKEEFRVCDSIDFYQWQKRVFANEPWRACMGCNMSVPRDPAVQFDEGFEGWGFEDVELAYRLTQQHGFGISIEPPTSISSIEIGSRNTYSTIRPRTSSEIEAFLNDLFRFELLHPNANLASFFRLCRLFRRDPSANRWARLADSFVDVRDVCDAIADARLWRENATNLAHGHDSGKE